MQQFCDIFGKKGDARHIILGDNPAGHGFVLRDLVLIELSGHAPPSSLGERGKEGGLKISEKILLGGEGVRNFNFGGVGGGGKGGGGVHVILK